MAIISLYCEETPRLKLGPGITSRVRTTPDEHGNQPLEPGDVIVFSDGFATFDSAEYPDWEQWVHAPGSPTIRVLSSDEGASETGETFACPVDGCDKGPFKTEFGLKGHLRSHAPKAPSTRNPKAKAKK